MVLQEVMVVVVDVGLLVVRLTPVETDLMIQRMDLRMEKGTVGSADTAKVVVVEVTLVDLLMVKLVMLNVRGGSMTAVAELVVGKAFFF